MTELAPINPVAITIWSCPPRCKREEEAIAAWKQALKLYRSHGNQAQADQVTALISKVHGE
ncbi:MAG: hypothetical protein HC930_04050 [Hydrococcus sp. SU_1_0]|nr:hypothetical protein [Hydrococcus sp. SU_1_0]